MAEESIKGPRLSCPACATMDVTKATYCHPDNRAFLGLGKLLKMLNPDEKGSAWCTKPGRHLHQKCNVCGFAWTGTPVEFSPSAV